MITLEDLRAIFRAARPEDIAELGPSLLSVMAAYGIHTPLRRAHFLAQVGHESGQLRYRSEIASGAAYEGRGDLGNCLPGDGKRFKGRGLIQLTGRANYQRYDADRGMLGALLANPRQVAKDPFLCCDVAGWFWNSKALNALADADDVRRITRKINGGDNGLADRRVLLLRAKERLGCT